MHLCYFLCSCVKIVAIYALLVCKICGQKIRSCKFFDKSQVWLRKMHFTFFSGSWPDLFYCHIPSFEEIWETPFNFSAFVGEVSQWRCGNRHFGTGHFCFSFFFLFPQVIFVGIFHQFCMQVMLITQDFKKTNPK